MKIISCTKCKLSLLEVNDLDPTKGTGKLLPKEATKFPTIMIIGMNPSRRRMPNLEHAFGANDNTTDKGSGSHFLYILKKLNIYDNCHITNLVKCSTTDNQITNEQILSCYKHILWEEINITNPKIILALGNQTYNSLLTLEKDYNIKKIYHPSYCFDYHRIPIDDYINQIKAAII